MDSKEIVKMVQDKDPKSVANLKVRILDKLKEDKKD